MAAKLSDGTLIETTDIYRLLAIVAERSKGHNPATVEQPAPNTIGLSEKTPVSFDVRIEEIRSRDGVTIKTGNLQLKTEKAGDHENFIEVLHKGWTIRVWIYHREKVFGCNVFRDSGRVCQYFEFRQSDYRDENAVFKLMTTYIDDGAFRHLE